MPPSPFDQLSVASVPGKLTGTVPTDPPVATQGPLTDEIFATPPFAQLAAYRELLALSDADFLRAINSQVDSPSFVCATTIDDGMHYEARVAQGLVSTRPNSWHDRFGALAWLEFPHSKRALNALQMAGLVRVGPKERTRHQQALTHVDEAGLIVACADAGWLDAMLEHRWTELLTSRRKQLNKDVEVWVLGHALFELKLTRTDELLAGKVLPVMVEPGFYADSPESRREQLDRRIAAALLAGELAADPKDLPTLPLAALAGWHPRNADPAFIASAPCFRPKPAGRIYAPPVELCLPNQPNIS